MHTKNKMYIKTIVFACLSRPRFWHVFDVVSSNAISPKYGGRRTYPYGSDGCLRESEQAVRMGTAASRDDISICEIRLSVRPSVECLLPRKGGPQSHFLVVLVVIFAGGATSVP